MSLNTELNKNLKKRLDSGRITDQKYWKFIYKLNSFTKARLERPALIFDGETITYREMFEKWECYARVFSALDITGANASRVGFLSSRDVESVYAFYGLNMTGASVSLLHELDVLDHRRWNQMIRKEGITDLILSYEKTDFKRLRFITDRAGKLGLKNIIILDDEKGNSNGKEYNRMHEYSEVLFMSELLTEYEDQEIIYSPDKSQEGAVIFHTSGTTNGIHKPVPLSDLGFNESAARLLRDERFRNLENVVTILTLELTSSYGTCDMLHLPLAYGGAVVIPSFEDVGERIFELIRKYRVSVLFTLKDSFEAAYSMKKKPDLSSLEMVFLGGTYVSAAAKQKIIDYLDSCDSSGHVYVGYGLTEAGGAVTLSDDVPDEDSIGKPLSGVKVKILDEEDGKYHDISEGKRTGVLCISSPSVSSGKLDGETFFDLLDIEGERYLNTYDLVEIKPDGNMRIVGRMNKFFVNNEGIRFNAGLIETAVGAQEGVENCALAPQYNKQLHDTVPVLYVQMKNTDEKSRIAIEDALYQIFIKDGKIEMTNLPSMLVIVKSLPLNQSGKVDIRMITDGEAKGKKYVIKPIRKRGKLIDVRVIPRKDAGIYSGGGIPEELEYDMDLYKELYEGSDDYMRKHGKASGAPFLARVLKGFIDEMEMEIDIDDREDEFDDERDYEREDRYGRRGKKRRRPMDLSAIYNGFGEYDDEEDDSDDEDDEEAEEYEEDDDDNEDDSSDNRGCSERRQKDGSGQMDMLSKMGRYFNASDYDEFYEE